MSGANTGAMDGMQKVEMTEAQAQVAEMFGALSDAGWLTVNQARAAIKMLDDSLEEAVVDEMIREADKGGTGKIRVETLAIMLVE